MILSFYSINVYYCQYFQFPYIFVCQFRFEHQYKQISCEWLSLHKKLFTVSWNPWGVIWEPYSTFQLSFSKLYNSLKRIRTFIHTYICIRSHIRSNVTGIYFLYCTYMYIYKYKTICFFIAVFEFKTLFDTRA